MDFGSGKSLDDLHRATVHAQRRDDLVRPEFAALAQAHFFSLAGQLTTNEKLCALVVLGDEFARNRPSGPAS